jgi:hypothetical protein
LARVETLEPPNFRTIQLEGKVTSGALRARGAQAAQALRPRQRGSVP